MWPFKKKRKNIDNLGPGLPRLKITATVMGYILKDSKMAAVTINFGDGFGESVIFDVPISMIASYPVKSKITFMSELL